MFSTCVTSLVLSLRSRAALQLENLAVPTENSYRVGSVGIAWQYAGPDDTGLRHALPDVENVPLLSRPPSVGVARLRHQIQVLERSRRSRPRLSRADRLLWMWLSHVWTEWRRALVIVRPETVIGAVCMDILWLLARVVVIQRQSDVPRPTLTKVAVLAASSWQERRVDSVRWSSPSGERP
jgi:hypothetical protein